jgi:transposase
MVRRKISKELWAALEPLVPKFVLSAKGGRRRSVDDRAAMNGILYVLRTGIPWEDLPQSLGFGSGMTCWRRLRNWQTAGVWEKLHLAMLERLREHDQIDWSRASIDGASVASPRGPRNRPQPDGPRQTRQQTTYRRRCQRRTTGCERHRRQSTRLHCVQNHIGRHSSRARSGQSPEEAAWSGPTHLRTQGLS